MSTTTTRTTGTAKMKSGPFTQLSQFPFGKYPSTICIRSDQAAMQAAATTNPSTMQSRATKN